VADRVAVAMWQWVGWIGNETVIILRGDFLKKDTGSGSGSGSGTKKTAPFLKKKKHIYIIKKSTHFHLKIIKKIHVFLSKKTSKITKITSNTSKHLKNPQKYLKTPQNTSKNSKNTSKHLKTPQKTQKIPQITSKTSKKPSVLLCLHSL
jgi:hypothetical protein